MHTFVMITDPPPNRGERGPLAGLSGTSPIPGTAGMTLRGVLRELWRGPWIQFGTRHPTADATEHESYADVKQPRETRTHGIDNDALRSAIEQGMFHRALR